MSLLGTRKTFLGQVFWHLAIKLYCKRFAVSYSKPAHAVFKKEFEEYKYHVS